MQIAGRTLTARKGFFDGTHRTRAPEDTLAAFRPLMPRLGITRLANITGLDRVGLPVVVAVRPNSRSLATSQGKGQTLAAAMASALMEAIESWHGERVALPLVSESYRTLAADGAAVDPARLGVRADMTFLPDRPIEWVEGWDLMAGRARLVPLDTVSNNFVEMPTRLPLFLKTTNGLASGNHLLEAIVHATYELIERDALTLFSLLDTAEQERRRIDPDSIDDAHLRSIFALLRDKGVAIRLEDATSDIGLPVYTCTLVDDPRSEHWRGVPTSSGHGAHLLDTIAVSRAVHEAIQSRATLISGSRDDMFQRDYANASGREAQVRQAEDAERAGQPIRNRGLTLSDRFEGDLAMVLDLLRHAGIGSAVAVDLSRQDVGVPVVKMVIPGLEQVRTALYRPGPRAQALMKGGRP